jgi:AraC-like DNA-binding protein
MNSKLRKSPVLFIHGFLPEKHVFDEIMSRHSFQNPIMMVAGSNRMITSCLEDHKIAAVVLRSGEAGEAEILNLLRIIAGHGSQVPVIVIAAVGRVLFGEECLKRGAFKYFVDPAGGADDLAGGIDLAVEVRCLKEVVSLLSETPCNSALGVVSIAGSDGPIPFQLPALLPDRLHRAIDYMESNLSQPLSLEEIAEQANLSKYYFCRLFRSYLGVSVVQFLQQRRLCLSTLLLKNARLSIAEVAVQSGFGDQNVFTKWFRKTTGFTPSSYRKSLGLRKL